MEGKYISVTKAMEYLGDISREDLYAEMNKEVDPLPHIKRGRVYKIVRSKLDAHFDQYAPQQERRSQ